jgi:site-specific DNA recombinase
MRVCLYQRISTDEDHQPTSLKTQRERLERYCEAMEDWRIVAAHEDQASGTSLDRPGLQQALDLAREKRIDLLLVYRVDRLSRKVRQLAGLCKELDQLDVILKSATEPFDTGSPAGRMMLQMLGVFAEFEHATIVDRVTAGLERRVREGKWMSGRTPYGYARDRDTKLLMPDEVKAPVVRRIFNLYAEGKLGTTAIARMLDAEAAPSPRKTGWSPNALQRILANPAYRGLVRWNNEMHPGLHEPLVDDETFERAQEILRRRGEDASLRRGNSTDYLLSGLVRCHHCGRAYVGTSAHGRNGRYTYYACSTRYKYGPAKCNGDRLPKDRLEAAVLAQLAELYRDGHVIEQALADLANATESERPEVEEQLASTRAEITRVESKLERYFEGFEDGRLAADLFQDRVRGHRDRLEALREREADLTARLATHAHTPPDGAALAGLADQLEAIVADENPEQAKELLRLLVKDIQVHDRRRIIPTYRIPAAVRAIPRKVGRRVSRPPPRLPRGAPDRYEGQRGTRSIRGRAPRPSIDDRCPATPGAPHAARPQRERGRRSSSCPDSWLRRRRARAPSPFPIRPVEAVALACCVRRAQPSRREACGLRPSSRATPA